MNSINTVFDFEEIEKMIADRLNCLFNPFFDSVLIHPSDLYPIVVNPMRKANDSFSIDLKLDNRDSYKVDILQYNEYYPNNMVNPRIQYHLVFAALKDYVEQNQSKVRVLGFLEFYSRTSKLDNVFCETTFIVSGDSIFFLHSDGITRNFIHMCEFLIDGYKVSCSGSYMFIEDLLNRQQYMYYGD